jgi:PhoH-like ATPase
MITDSKKVYILDTNVLIHDCRSMLSFENSLVGIPAVVLEELDRLKRESSDRGSSAREVIRFLDGLRTKGSLRTGVKLDNGSILQVIFPACAHGSNDSELFLTRAVGDNEILLTALDMKVKGYHVIFISKDINARVKADALNIEAQDYLKGRISEYDVYKGWRSIQIPANDLRKDYPDVLYDLATDSAQKLEQNEFIELQSNNNQYNNRVFRYLGHDKFKAVYAPELAWPLQPKNPQQLMALDLLMDDEIKLVSLVGSAGTGKTFLALLAGLHQVLIKDVYRKILISRPVIPLGPDIGYLPGNVQEKLESWMQPMYDNLNLIMHSVNNSPNTLQIESDGNFKKNKWNKNDPKVQDKWQKKKKSRVSFSMEDLIHSAKLSLEAMTYMRGRSIPFQYILIDEVQNLTLHEVKTLITRVGEGSKIIILGDPYQIDSPYLDFNSNGLMVANNAFKGQEIFGSVFLETTERSELSMLASKLL